MAIEATPTELGVNVRTSLVIIGGVVVPVLFIGFVLVSVFYW